MSDRSKLNVGLAQIAPIWLNRDKTIEKIIGYVREAAKRECRLVVFGEALIPGYPFWLERTEGAMFESSTQKDFHAHYLDQAVQIESGHLEGLCAVASENKVAVITGTIERPADRGGHSVYCSLVYIDAQGEIKTVHRKLMPTYDERLAWSIGDGHGLRVNKLSAFTVGALNCWENWMPLPRAALYGLGEDLHVAIWPGNKQNTHDITRFIAKESRSYVISVSGLMRKSDIPKDFPHYDLMHDNCEEMPADGGSCISAPTGKWLIEPIVGEERLEVATLDHEVVRRERQSFDPAGHYSRPDVTKLVINRERQSTIKLEEE